MLSVLFFVFFSSSYVSSVSGKVWFQRGEDVLHAAVVVAVGLSCLHGRRYGWRDLSFLVDGGPILDRDAIAAQAQVELQAALEALGLPLAPSRARAGAAQGRGGGRGGVVVVVVVVLLQGAV